MRLASTISLQNWIAMIAAAVALWGLWYQKLQIDRIDAGLEITREGLAKSNEHQAKELVAKAKEILTSSPQIQEELGIWVSRSGL